MDWGIDLDLHTLASFWHRDKLSETAISVAIGQATRSRALAPLVTWPLATVRIGDINAQESRGLLSERIVKDATTGKHCCNLGLKLSVTDNVI